MNLNSVVEQKGIILLTTAILLSLIMLVVLAQTELITLHYKALAQFTRQTHLLNHLETLAAQLIIKQKNLQQESNCLIKEMNPNEVIHLLQKQVEGCFIVDKQLTYIYLIEELGQFNCLTAQVNEKTYATRHWRLTIAALDDPLILQLRFAELAPLTAEVCKHRLIISPGILSWRFL